MRATGGSTLSSGPGAPACARWSRRGDAGATWVILTMFVVIALGAAWFYLASVENSEKKREVQAELDRREAELEDARLAARRELTRIRAEANDVNEVVDTELDEARVVLGKQREAFREQRNEALSLEAEIKALDGELEGLARMAAELQTEIARIEEDDARRGEITGRPDAFPDRDEATATGDDPGDRQPVPGPEPEPTRAHASPEEETASAAQRLIESTILEVGHVLDERGLLVAPDSGTPAVMADGFLLRDYPTELQGASAAERKVAEENLRRAALAVQSKVVMARVKLRKLGVARFESMVLDELNRMQEALAGAGGDR